jgi:hypothetical protein
MSQVSERILLDVRCPRFTLACIARTYEGICDGVALAQVSVVGTARTSVGVPGLQSRDGKGWV